MRTNDDTHLDIRYSINNIILELKTQGSDKLQSMADVLLTLKDLDPERLRLMANTIMDMKSLPMSVLKEDSRLRHVKSRRGTKFQHAMTKNDAKVFKAGRGDLGRMAQLSTFLDKCYSSEWFSRLIFNLSEADDLVGEQTREKQLAACDIFMESIRLSKKELGQMEHIFRRCKYDDRFLRATVLLLNAPDRTIEAIIKTFSY